MSFLYKCIFLTLSIFSATIAHSLDEATIGEQIRSLSWKSTPALYELSDTIATILTSSDEYLLTGTDAHKFMKITEGHDSFKPDALVVRVAGESTDTQVLFQHHDTGYLKLDDWNEHIDSDELLKQITESTKKANNLREAGYPHLFIDGWVQEPFLDVENAIVYWAIALHTSEGSSVVNAKALKLGRNGFTEIVWMGEANKFVSARDSLSPSIAAYVYNDGAKYLDFVPGTDTVAAVGIGALTYKMITGKAASKVGVGILAVLAVFLKKFWFLLFIPFIAGWKWLVKRFKSKK